MVSFKFENIYTSQLEGKYYVGPNLTRLICLWGLVWNLWSKIVLHVGDIASTTVLESDSLAFAYTFAVI